MSVEKIYSKSYDWTAAEAQSARAIANATARVPNLTQANPYAVFGRLVAPRINSTSALWKAAAARAHRAVRMSDTSSSPLPSISTSDRPLLLDVILVEPTDSNYDDDDGRARRAAALRYRLRAHAALATEVFKRHVTPSTSRPSSLWVPRGRCSLSRVTSHQTASHVA